MSVVVKFVGGKTKVSRVATFQERVAMVDVIIFWHILHITGQFDRYKLGWVSTLL